MGGLAMGARIDSGRAIRVVWFVSLLVLSSFEGAEAGRVRGTVVDREGKPAAGAKVWAAKLGYLEPLESREATADGSGAYGIEVGNGDWAVFALQGDEGGRASWESI